MARFQIYLEPLQEGGFLATVPALPGCVTWGDNKEQTLTRIAEAIEGYIASLRKHGEEVPSGIEQATIESIEIPIA